MRRFLSILLALGLVLSFSLLTAVPTLAASEVWVDDDAPNDPGPGDNTVSDPLEDGTLAHPYDKIQEGITAADLLTGVVHVAAGTYNEHNILMKNGVDVLGAGADVTTIVGDGSGGPVVNADSIGSGTTFDGFKVTNGGATVGGGIYISSASLTVSNCIFTDNHASDQGGGMFIINTSSPTVVNCIFYDNTAVFFGGGICCVDSVVPTFTNNTIANNTAGFFGGGIYLYNTSPIIRNNIIADNDATTGGGIFADLGAAPDIDYNDLWHNNPDDYFGCSAGLNDISADPPFAVPGDYHLQAGSPCADVGDNTEVPADTADLDGDGNTTEPIPYDFDGDPRIWGDVEFPVVDMGADEYSDNQPPFAPDITFSGYRDGSWTDDNTPEFSFIQDDPNDWDTVKYTFQIDDDPLFGSPAVNFTSGLLDQDVLEVFTSPTLPDGEYYWQVRSTDRYDAEGPWADGSLTPGEPAFRLDTSPAGGGTVGGEVYPIDKTVLLLPWLGLSIIMILAAGGLIIIKRQAN